MAVKPKSLAHDAADLAGNPNHSLAKFAAVSIGASTASTVAGYQLNRGLSKVTHDVPPALSGSTGGMPNTTGETISKTATSVKHKVSRRKGRRNNVN